MVHTMDLSHHDASVRGRGKIEIVFKWVILRVLLKTRFIHQSQSLASNGVLPSIETSTSIDDEGRVFRPIVVQSQ
jgi:hypothetical protein